MTTTTDSLTVPRSQLVIGVLALQGAFEEHEQCLRAVGCSTKQVRTPDDLQGLDGIVLPGGESTAMGLIGTSTTTTRIGPNSNDRPQRKTMWECLQEFSQHKPTWGTCAGMILLAEQCVGTSAVITNGQSLIGGVDICVCRNYFGSQISSFEMATPAPPIQSNHNNSNTTNTTEPPYPGVFIRAPAILSAGPSVQILGKVTATPCRQAAVTLAELERKIALGEPVIKTMAVVDALDHNSPTLDYVVVMADASSEQEEKKQDMVAGSSSNSNEDSDDGKNVITLPGAADGTNAREVICAVRKDNLLCTAFHPELTDDHRWHEYFARMVEEWKESQS